MSSDDSTAAPTTGPEETNFYDYLRNPDKPNPFTCYHVGPCQKCLKAGVICYHLTLDLTRHHSSKRSSHQPPSSSMIAWLKERGLSSSSLSSSSSFSLAPLYGLPHGSDDLFANLLGMVGVVWITDDDTGMRAWMLKTGGHTELKEWMTRNNITPTSFSAASPSSSASLPPRYDPLPNLLGRVKPEADAIMKDWMTRNGITFNRNEALVVNAS